MSQYPKLTLTDAAIEMIAESQLDSTDLEITKVKIGDGSLAENTDIKTMSDIIASKLEAPMTSSKNDGNGQLTINFAIGNENVNSGFFAREIGIFAKITGGEEKLYAYTNAGNKCDWIPDKRTPIDSQVVTATLIVGNASNVTVNIKDNAYVLTIELAEHNTDANAHAEMLEKHNADKLAHPDLRTLVLNSGINILKRSHAYEVGDIAYSPLLKSYQRLECVVGGVTASTDIDVQTSTTGGY